MLNMILCGACGRMGRVITALAPAAGIRIVAGVDVSSADAPACYPIYPHIDMVSEQADVLLDFTRPEALPALLKYAVRLNLPVVLAATGYGSADFAQISEAAAHIAVFQSANMSVGITLLRRLCAMATRALPEADIEIVETHHANKLDAPSGTALTLLNTISEARETPSTPVFGRHTRTQAREKTEIGLHAVRGGTIAGIHEVGFYLGDEYITLTHTAQSRDIFAQGALKAVRFMQNRQPGRYGMDDLLAEQEADSTR